MTRGTVSELISANALILKTVVFFEATEKNKIKRPVWLKDWSSGREQARENMTVTVGGHHTSCGWRQRHSQTRVKGLETMGKIWHFMLEQ